MTENDLRKQRDLIEKDLTLILDGLDNDTFNKVCEVIDERFEILITNLKEKVIKDFLAKP